VIYKKILLLGDFNVGKTSLIRRYVDDSFDDKYLSTIGVKISKKSLNMHNLDIEFLIWDIEGNTPTKPIPTHYFRGASGAIFVADITREQSMLNLLNHIQTFVNLNPDSEYVIAYNKVDLLTKKQIENMGIDLNAFLTSAKNKMNVEVLFETLASKMCLK